MRLIDFIPTVAAECSHSIDFFRVAGQMQYAASQF
jgi:hypothetical protein